MQSCRRTSSRRSTLILCRRFSRARQERRHAFLRLGIGEQRPGEFQFVGIAAAAGLTGGSDAGLTRGERRRRQVSDTFSYLRGACGEFGARRRPMHYAERGGGCAVEHFSAEDQSFGERRAVLPAGPAWLRWPRYADRKTAQVQIRRP